VHWDSEFYDNTSFIKGKNSLNAIELPILGDLTGKSVLHLQCHFGQDTITFDRLGASKAVGVDLSDKAIDRAIELATLTESAASFVCCDIYDLPGHLHEQFDIVFSSYGTIGWLPDLNKWAALISKYLKPGGRFVFAEFHPFVWTFDDNFNKISYDYFNTKPLEETESSYTDGSENLQTNFICWNHGLGEVMKSLRSNGLQITFFDEYDYSPYSCFNDVAEFEPGKYRIKKIDKLIPMVYALEAVKL